MGLDGKSDPIRAAVYEVGHPHGVWCLCHQQGHPGQEPAEPDLLDLLEAMGA